MYERVQKGDRGGRADTLTQTLRLMTKLDADTILDAVEDDAPVDADFFEERIVTAARQWCDLAYKGRLEDAADHIWDSINEISQIVQVDDAIEAAHALLDIAEQSGDLSETQMAELADLREWIESEGSMYNFKRALN